MAVGTTFDCASLPTWQTSQCCLGCHDTAADVRPTRLRLGASAYVVCCRAQLHGVMALGADATLNLDALALPSS